METTEKAIAKIKKEGVGEIVEVAMCNFTEGFNAVVFYDPASDSYEGRTWSSGTYLNPKSRLEEVFRLDGNWIANNSWEVNDILDDQEYKNLKQAIAEKEGLTDDDDIEDAADFLDATQLELIEVSLYDRLVEYILYDDDLQDQIIEGLENY